MEKTVVVGANIPTDALRQLDRIARTDPLRPSRSQLIRLAIMEFLAQRALPVAKDTLTAE